MKKFSARRAALLAVLASGFWLNAPVLAQQNDFVGSAACRDCHESQYERWRGTRMANVIVDAQAYPEAVLGDFATPNPLVTFEPDDIAFTYGSKWKQRYFTKRGDDYFVFPVQWDVLAKTWRRYYVENGTDWWAVHYPADQMQRPTGPLCDGCHSTNYDIATKQVTEWNVGCEKCHGPGDQHVRNPQITNIVNPARLDHTRGVDVCIQCHSQGQPLKNPIEGRYYDWPVGYLPGDRLADFWRLEEHKLGEETFTHWPDGSAHKNRMQGNDYVQSAMYLKGVSCWDCHDVHGTANPADLIKPPESLCGTCHGPDSPAGPPGTTAEHTHHSTGNVECQDCHMPTIARTIADVSVRSHTFRFISPAMTERSGIPNPCTLCHVTIAPAAALEEIRRWPDVSTWRLE
jgi:predicted CXXCH cytochrome family protein